MPLKLVDESFSPPAPDIAAPSLPGAVAHVRMAVEHLSMAYAHVVMDPHGRHDELRRSIAEASARLGFVIAKLASALRHDGR